jgi:hypothetical protein
MGIFVANATLRDKSYHVGNWEGWSISRQGYLTAPILAYALALFAWLRRETQPGWAGYLRLDVRSPFREAQSYRLGKTKKALADREEAAQRAKSLGKHESAPELRTSIIHPPGIG